MFVDTMAELTAMAAATAWEGARCAQVDPELFFPEMGGTVNYAKRICRGCPVRRTCLDFAMTHFIADGVWGGTSPKDRRRLRRLNLAA